MLNEFRRLWCEDQYQILQVDTDANFVFCGRERGSNFIVYRIDLARANRRRRVVCLQTVNLDQDWFWDSNRHQLVSNESNLIDCSSYRTEHILTGHCWISADKYITCDKGLEDLSDQVQTFSTELSTGACATYYLPQKCTSWLISLHGGPESFEGSEIRYGGLYRQLFRHNIGVVVLNYSGSKTPGGQILGIRTPWGRWQESIVADYRALLQDAQKIGINLKSSHLMGASFGGALALILRQQFNFSQVVLCSPLLSLVEQRKRGGSEYEDWFANRFSAEDEKMFCPEQLLPSFCQRVHLIYGEEDEVLGNKHFKAMYAIGGHIIRRSGGHVPKTYQEHNQQDQFFKRALNLVYTFKKMPVSCRGFGGNPNSMKLAVSN